MLGELMPPVGSDGPGCEVVATLPDLHGEEMRPLLELLEDDSVKKVGQNLKYDFLVFRREGIDLRGIEFDTMVASYLLDADIPTAIISWVKAHFESQVAFLLILNVILLVLGSVFEIYSASVILAPLVAPLGEAYGLHPIHLAIVFLANLELGFLFPPVGLNLFLSSSRFQKPLPQLYRHAFPFLLIMSASVLLITYIPAMTVGVLSLFGIEYR
jgi:hypothetical protein